MSTSDVQWPAVKARLVELAPTLDGWSDFTVFDGPADTSTLAVDEATMTAAWATIGFTTNDQSGECTFDQDADGYQQVERGTVHIELTVQCADNDSADLAALEARLFAALSGLKAAVRADRRLGVLSQEGFAAAVITTTPIRSTAGAAAVARVAVTYYTVT